MRYIYRISLLSNIYKLVLLIVIIGSISFSFSAISSAQIHETEVDITNYEDGMLDNDQISDLFNRQNSESLAEHVPGEVLIKFRDGADPQEAIESLSNSGASLNRIRSIELAVNAYKSEHKIQKDSNGWYWFFGKMYESKENISDQEIFDEAYSHLSEEEQALYRTYKLILPDGVEVVDAINTLSANQDVEYVEPNYIYTVQMQPNDTYYNTTINSWGQSFDDLWGLKKIDCENAWDISLGDGVVVAVIDSGVDYDHEDLQENIWLNQEELKIDHDGDPSTPLQFPGGLDSQPDGVITITELLEYTEDHNGDGTKNLQDIFNGPLMDGIDADVNGSVDDIIGYDFNTFANESMDNDSMDENGHGTHCAGIIAAVANNVQV